MKHFCSVDLQKSDAVTIDIELSFAAEAHKNVLIEDTHVTSN